MRQQTTCDLIISSNTSIVGLEIYSETVCYHRAVWTRSLSRMFKLGGITEWLYSEIFWTFIIDIFVFGNKLKYYDL